MKISITTNEIPIPKKLFGAKVEKDLEFDSALPDYCPDIARLIKVDCTPFTESCTIEGEHITVKGKAVYDILYETDYKNRLRCCSFTQEFSQTVSIPKTSATDPSAFCTVRCEKINCKLFSPRRFVIKAVLSTKFDVEGEILVKALAITEEKETFFKKKTIGFEGRTAMHSETFRFSDTFALNQGEKSIGEIVCGNVLLQSPQIMLSPGHAEIKTTASIHALCEEENSEGKYYMSIKSLPINIDYPNEAIEDFKHIAVSLEPSELEILPELDQYGESRVIKTSFSLNMNLKLNEPKAYTVAEDMFEKGFECTLTNGTASMPHLYSQNETSFSTEAKIAPTFPKAESILDYRTSDYGSRAEKSEGGINISGNFIVTILAETAEGIFGSDHTVPYNHFFQTELPDADSEVVADTYPIETLLTLHTDGSITARIIAGSKIFVYTENEENFVAEVSKRIPAEQTDESALIYCFPAKNEVLWDIAKFYHADPDLISSANPKRFDEFGKNTDPNKPILIKV